jgi:hypothetical protein
MPGQEQQETLAKLEKATNSEEKRKEFAMALKEALFDLTKDDGPTIATIKEQHSEEQLRGAALGLAIDYHDKREGTPEVVTHTADVFFAYINNGASA